MGRELGPAFSAVERCTDDHAKWAPGLFQARRALELCQDIILSSTMAHTLLPEPVGIRSSELLNLPATDTVV